MGISQGDTVGVVLVVSKEGGECVARCRCGKEFPITEVALMEMKSIVDAGHRIAFPPYVCRCSYENAYWDSFGSTQSTGTHSRMSDSTEYQTWYSLVNGCHNPDFERYASLGKKGYSVCKRWRNSFDNFLNDLGRRPSPDHVLFIKPRMFQYSRHSCRWVSREEWRRLQPRASLHTFDGVEKSLVEWAEEFSKINGLPPYNNRQRILRGWSMERILSQPERKVSNVDAK